MLFIHIAAGSVLLLFGFVALSVMKGQYKHRLSGNLFFISLLFMTGSAALLTDDPKMALLTLYYGATAWAVIIRKENSTGIFEILAMIAIALVSVRLFHFAFTATDLHPTFKFILLAHASVAALAVLLDLNMIIRGGLSGKHRIVRHAWRTCFALLGAVMSFSSNTSEYWPRFIDSNALIYLMLFVLFYWLIRVLFTSWYNQIIQSVGDSLLARKLLEAKQSLNGK